MAKNRPQTLTKSSIQKSENFFKKSVDIYPGGWYYVQARSRATNLENDTEQNKNANDSQ